MHKNYYLGVVMMFLCVHDVCAASLEKQPKKYTLRRPALPIHIPSCFFNGRCGCGWVCKFNNARIQVQDLLVDDRPLQELEGSAKVPNKQTVMEALVSLYTLPDSSGSSWDASSADLLSSIETSPCTAESISATKISPPSPLQPVVPPLVADLLRRKMVTANTAGTCGSVEQLGSIDYGGRY